MKNKNIFWLIVVVVVVVLIASWYVYSNWSDGLLALAGTKACMGDFTSSGTCTGGGVCLSPNLANPHYCQKGSYAGCTWTFSDGSTCEEAGSGTGTGGTGTGGTGGTGAFQAAVDILNSNQTKLNALQGALQNMGVSF
ncbi:MAG: hypothetical protein ABH822_02240 [Patescibacteria group bacterium]